MTPPEDLESVLRDAAQVPWQPHDPRVSATTTPAGATELRVRLATPFDASAVHTMVREIAAHQGQLEHVTADVVAWQTMLARPEVVVLIAELGEEHVGYVSAVRRLHLWSGETIVALDDLFVRAGYRDGGVGRALMENLAARFPGSVISWGVQPDNIGAIRFYERLGAVTRKKVLCGWKPQHDASQLEMNS